jgi:hypothetical protein
MTAVRALPRSPARRGRIREDVTEDSGGSP